MAKKKTFIDLGIHVQITREGDYFIAYSPALDFSSCGNTLKEAQEMFSKGILLFLEELNRMGTLGDVLEECGWQKVDKPKPHYVPPEVVAKPELEIRIPCPA